MSNKPVPRRVALAVEYLTASEDAIIAGILDYAGPSGGWSFVGRRHRPFLPLNEINFDAVDGVIGRIRNHQQAEELAGLDLPFVETSTGLADMPLPRVSTDDPTIGRMGAKHLLERGLNHFGFIHHPTGWYSQRRLAAFQQVIEEAGRTLNIVETPYDTWDLYEQRVPRWLRQSPKPLGIMAYSDNMAFEVINTAVGLDLRVPEEVSVLGVNNSRWANAMAAVPMSSIDPNWHEVGYRAAQTLDGLMAGKKPPPAQWILPIGVITRHSTEFSHTDDPVVNHAMRFISDHFSQEIDVEDIAEAARVSRTTLETRMKNTTGQTPHNAICWVRVKQAEKMLAETRATMDEISRACGFRFQPCLNRVFKRLTGMTPGQFRQQRSR